MSVDREEQASAVSAVGFKAAQLRLEVQRAMETCKGENERLLRWLERVGEQAQSVEETTKVIVGVMQEAGT